MKIYLAGPDVFRPDALAWADAARDVLARYGHHALIFDKQVVVEWKKENRYGRTVGKVLVNGIDANLAQVKAGMAWWYRDYAKEQSVADRRLYGQAEQQAQAQRLGLWADKNPVPPWDFRHAKAGTEMNQQCPCSGTVRCTGPKGGRYCLTDRGSKNYQ